MGEKSLSFENALKTLIPLKNDHFLARRFGNPDLLEKEAKEDPVAVIKLLLKNLGPQSASDIKDNLFELVIPENDWSKWWQAAKTKLKKDRKIICPKKSSDHYIITEEDISFEDTLIQELKTQKSTIDIIKLIYSFLKDFALTIKNEDFKKSLILKLLEISSHEVTKLSEKLQINYFFEMLKAEDEIIKIKDIILEVEDFNQLLSEIEIISFKKRTLVYIKDLKDNYENIFLNLFLQSDQNSLRDFIFYSLIEINSSHIKDKINELINHPVLYPQTFIWYFQKIFSNENENIPFMNKEGKLKFFESFLILLDHLQRKNDFKDLCKKMVLMITSNKYLLVRDIMQIATVTQAKEYLLLATKCSLLEVHDIKIIHSLAKVAHEQLSSYEDDEKVEDVIWATEKGYNKLKQKIEHLTSFEMIDNAKEIEEARSHGDLRENAEYKAALERRSRLQSEIQSLADQISKVQIINFDEIDSSKVSIGTKVTIKDLSGNTKKYTILGPFEADVEKNILSFNSKLALAMIDKKVGEKFSFNQEEYVIINIQIYL